MRLLALTRSSEDASALAKQGTRSMAGIALLRILRSSFVDRAIYNISPKAMTRAFGRGLPDVVPSLLGRHRVLLPRQRPLLDRSTVLLVDRYALSANELKRLRVMAEEAGSRILLGELPGVARERGLQLELSARQGRGRALEIDPSLSVSHPLRL